MERDELSFEHIVLMFAGHPRNPKGSRTSMFGSLEKGLGRSRVESLGWVYGS